MAYIKADNEKEQEYFDYLEELRQSGATNMFGARPYLQKAFLELRKKDTEAGEIVQKWMKLHSDPARRIA